MKHAHGFKLENEQQIKEINTLGQLFQHEKTGAELLSLINTDENKVFGISFRTPPTDSTGIAHILEHSVLCGSKKYPVKEPFVELIKGSLNTFLNAFTYPDKTCYPVASQNLQDFYNLIDVYLDAVFYPKITPSIFQQEGWHYETESLNSPIFYKGVVFNEMKGAYSSPDNVLSEKSTQSIFPDNPYGLDSGGNPRSIPNLSFEQFKGFHKKYYHPSNARLFFYGNDNPEERLKIANNYLENFESIKIDSNIILQPPFKTPKYLQYPFMVGQDAKQDLKGMLTINWLLPETTAINTNFALRMLEYILLGMPASPLRKALIDSGLGEDLAGTGLETELRQMSFSTGLKGIDISKAKQIEKLVFDTLKSLVRNGIDSQTIEAAVNTIEFKLRENNTGTYPRGLILMLRSLSTWLYGGNPMSLLCFEEPLEAIKASISANKPIFEEMLQRFFIDNNHRSIIIFNPDPYMEKRMEETEKNQLAQIKKGLSDQELKKLMINAGELKDLQNKPDSPEDLATIPVLKLSDLDKKNTEIPISIQSHNGTRILLHDIFSNSVIYLDVGFDFHSLSQEYISYLPLFGRALLEIGTTSEDYIQLIKRINCKTGGIRSLTNAFSVKDASSCSPWIFLRAKVMPSQFEELINILKDILLNAKFDNKMRFRQMALEEKSRMEKSLIPSGHSFINLRLRSHYGEAHWTAEQMEGISYIFFLRDLIKTIDKDWPSVLSALENIHKIIINSHGALFNITLDQSNWPIIEKQVYELIDMLPQTPSTFIDWHMKTSLPFEGFTIPSQVNYIGKGMNLYQDKYQFHGSFLVITRYLRTSWLWDKVRVQGGAYGAFCLIDRISGILSFVSYRDPNHLETLNIFDQSAQFLYDLKLNKNELAKSIIGTIGLLDSYHLPDAKGYFSMTRFLTGDTDKLRQEMRDEIFSTKSDDFKSFAGLLEKIKDSYKVKILGSPSTFKKIAIIQPDWLKTSKVL